ncbi:uncharacterized protein LOC6551084 [Drosophila erecta]|uniref:uncharacterized protein LOC6551084 n=1 Tax=Drosophila erecta TaxID=7220 RepID=UPI000F066CD6|nr:uncharacterized protein LOC6551084 [Drosophila erecta]
MEGKNQNHSKANLKNILENNAAKNELAADLRCSRAKMLLLQMDADKNDGQSDYENVAPQPNNNDPAKPADQGEILENPQRRSKSSRGKQMHICARDLPKKPCPPPRDEAFSMCTGKRKVLDSIAAIEQRAAIGQASGVHGRNHNKEIPLQNVAKPIAGPWPQRRRASYVKYRRPVMFQPKQELRLGSKECALNASTVQLIPEFEGDYVQEWLEKTAPFLDHTVRQEAAAAKALQATPSACSASDSDDAVEADLSDLLTYMSDAELAEQVGKPLVGSAELCSAFPDSCVTDAILTADRPKDAVRLGQALPPLNVQDCCEEGDFIGISVCKVYSPFQFWFHFVPPVDGDDPLAELSNEMNTFYNHAVNPAYRTQLPSYFHKADYICAAEHGTGWRRARVLYTAPKEAAWLHIYHVDYATSAELSPSKLRFLPERFADMPIQAARGTLSHIQPLGIHWPPDSTSYFKSLVYHTKLHAHVIQLDAAEGILFMRLSQTEKFAPSINKLLVEGGLATISENYSEAVIKFNCGRRLRYLRERLPSFEMLESRTIPLNDEEFENYFDSIIYNPSFHNDFQLPKLKNPILKALTAWMPGYRHEQEHWRRIYKQADQKVLEARRRAKEALGESQEEVHADPGGQLQQGAGNQDASNQPEVKLEAAAPQEQEKEELESGNQSEKDTDTQILM